VKLFSYLCGIFKLGIVFPKGYSLVCYIVLKSKVSLVLKMKYVIDILLLA